MTYTVFIDSVTGGKKHSLWNNLPDCKDLTDALRNHGYFAWWEYAPAPLPVPNGTYCACPPPALSRKGEMT